MLSAFCHLSKRLTCEAAPPLSKNLASLAQDDRKRENGTSLLFHFQNSTFYILNFTFAKDLFACAAHMCPPLGAGRKKTKIQKRHQKKSPAALFLYRLFPVQRLLRGVRPVYQQAHPLFCRAYRAHGGALQALLQRKRRKVQAVRPRIGSEGKMRASWGKFAGACRCGRVQVRVIKKRGQIFLPSPFDDEIFVTNSAQALFFAQGKGAGDDLVHVVILIFAQSAAEDDVRPLRL